MFIAMVYIVFHTYIIICDESMGFTIDDYAVAALLLYIDLIRFFMEILAIMGKK